MSFLLVDSIASYRTRAANGTQATESGATYLFGYQYGDLFNRIEVIHSRFMSLDPDSKMVFEERDQLERANRVEDTACDQPALVV
jgi:hypothetical protein